VRGTIWSPTCLNISYIGGDYFLAPIPLCGKRAPKNFQKKMPTIYVDPLSLLEDVPIFDPGGRLREGTAKRMQGTAKRMRI